MFEGQVRKVCWHPQIESDLILIFASVHSGFQHKYSGFLQKPYTVYIHLYGSLYAFSAEDAHLTRTVPAVLRLHPQLLIPIDQAVGAAGPLAVAALQLGQPRLGIVQLKRSTRSLVSANSVKSQGSWLGWAERHAPGVIH